MSRYFLLLHISLLGIAFSIHFYFNEHRPYFHISLLGAYLIISLFFLSRTSRFAKSLTFFIGFILFSECSVRFFAHKYDNGNVVYHFLIPLQLLFYAELYAKLFKNNKSRTIVNISLMLCSLSILNTIYLQEFKYFPSNSLILLSSFLITLSLMKFKEMISLPTSIRLRNQSEFWFNLGTFLFYSLTFFVFSFFPFIINGPEWMLDLVFFLNISLYLCYFFSILLESRPNFTSKL